MEINRDESRRAGPIEAGLDVKSTLTMTRQADRPPATLGDAGLAAPVFDHTGSICLVLASMGPSGSFDSDAAGKPAQTLRAATLRLSRRFGWIAAAGESLA